MGEGVQRSFCCRKKYLFERIEECDRWGLLMSSSCWSKWWCEADRGVLQFFQCWTMQDLETYLGFNDLPFLSACPGIRRGPKVALWEVLLSRAHPSPVLYLTSYIEKGRFFFPSLNSSQECKQTKGWDIWVTHLNPSPVCARILNAGSWSFPNLKKAQKDMIKSPGFMWNLPLSSVSGTVVLCWIFEMQDVVLNTPSRST